jgi:hypothetical protein
LFATSTLTIIFVYFESHLTLPVPAPVAGRKLWAALTCEALQTESAAACHDGLDLIMSVGPARGGMAKRVCAHVLPPRVVGSTVVIPLRWEAAGVTGRWYPTLDANIGITPVNETTSVLSLLGSYTPPLGSFGQVVDNAAMSRVAEATIDSLLHRFAAAVAHAQSQLLSVL